MEPIDYNCEKHIFVCTNDRNNPLKADCKKVGGQEMYLRFKTKIRDSGLTNRVWVTRTGCLGFCNDVGTTVLVHAKGKESKMYNEVTDQDFERIWNEII